MALTLFSSNRVEALQARLVQQLVAAPLRDPLASEQIVVPTYAMGRWLNLRIAQQQGIAANFHYPQPSPWIRQLSGRILQSPPGEDSYTPEAMGWRIFDRLPALLPQAPFAALGRYLAGDDSGIKRWQLARRIAEAFDRYQLYRPALVQSWSTGAESHWQATLWRDITADLEQAPRISVVADAISQLQDPGAALNLPQRISLFANSSLAPLLIEFIHALAIRTEVVLYQHSPTDQYWADLVSEKSRARLRLQNPDFDAYVDTRNSLLTSWGRQGQSLQDLLLDLGPVIANEVDLSRPPGAGRMLQALQNSLFSLEEPSATHAVDDSLSLHRCHSPMRECQVLHDYLLDLLDRNTDIAAEDILVMVPEISRYAPYIEAVFQPDESGRRPGLPWNISDISVSVGHPLIAIFLQLLRLPSSRFTCSEVMACLECAEIRQRFGIETRMLEAIYDLVDAARVRWGIDAGQRAALGLPEVPDNTWQQAWERLFSGYAFDLDGLWRDIAPLRGLDHDAALAIARLRHLFARLVAWRERLARPASAGTWQDRLLQLIDEFFAVPLTVDEQRQPLRDAISQLGQATFGELSPALVSHWMENRLQASQQAGRLYSGGVTFCGMQPLRNIPFPVICVLGMQDQAFPRRDQRGEFDLMRDDWRPGDPLRGDEDRYLMLETLLSARRYLYFSYCGRSLRDNSECQPSALLRELLDYIDAYFAAAPNTESASQSITQDHPMQAFSPRNFTPGKAAYDRHWFATATRLAERSATDRAVPWPRQALPAAALTEALDLDELLRFFSHPIRYFYQQRLDLRLLDEKTLEDEEAFNLDALRSWELVERLAEDLLRDGGTGLHQLRAEGLMPHGGLAAGEWRRLQDDFRGLFAGLREYCDREAETRRVECRLDGGQLLYGNVAGCYTDTGLMRYSASKGRPARAVLALWLNHLALCATGQRATNEVSRLVLPDSSGVYFAPVDADQARSLLQGYTDLYREGQCYPLPVFPKTSYAWAQEQDAARAMQKARAAWQRSQGLQSPPGESENPYIRLALHNLTLDPLADPHFQALARQIFGPAIERASDHA